MTRPLLLCLCLGLSQFAEAAPCDILPYANQCQGSNLWPVPSGWSADNNGDCQPQPPTSIPVLWGLGWVMGYNSIGPLPRIYDYAEAASACAVARSMANNCDGYADLSLVELESGSYHSFRCCLMGGVGWNSYISVVVQPRAYCPTGYTVSPWNSQVCLPTTPITGKPANSVCTSRWTSAAKAALEKDTMDPDCDANSCVMDSVCKLR